MDHSQPHCERRVISLFIWGLVLLVVGCSQSSEALLQKTLRASREAQAAAAQQDAEGARAAAQRAAEALEQLEARAESQEAAKPVVGEARLAALAARNCAELAEEQHQRRDRLSSWKVKGYHASRGLLLQSVCSAAAVGAERMAKQGTNAITLGDRNLAEDARRLALFIQELEQNGSTEPDWTVVARQFRQWATNPPVEANLFLGMALFSVGQRDLALAEIECIRTNRLASTNAFLLHHGARTLVYALNGWNHLAAAEAEQVAVLAPGSDYVVKGEDLVFLVHAFLAVNAFLERDLKTVDREIAECVKLSPNNPVVVYLTGERLAANGQWEKAAQSLEASAASAKDPWYTQRLAQRARDLRDGKGSSRSLVLDPKFLFEYSVHLFADKARNSEAAQKLESLSEQASAMGKRVLEKLSP